jgi:hypothetical protein
MNQIEIWLGIVVKKDDLENRALAFIDYFNATMAEPFKWTHSRQGLDYLGPDRRDLV